MTKVVVRYEPEDELLFMHDGRRGKTAWGIYSDWHDMMLEIIDVEPKIPVGITAKGAAGYLELKQGYDAETDTLAIGETDDPHVVDGGVFVGYWTLSDQEEDGIGDLVEVEIRDASVHFASIKESLKPAA